MNTEVNTKQTQQAYFDRFTALYGELDMLNQDIKQLTEEFKEDYESVDVANIKRVAKLKSEGKLSDTVLKTEMFLEAVEEYTH